MRAILLLLVSTLVSGCMATIPTNYAGIDAGYAVIGIGTSKHPYIKYDTYNFQFRRVGEKNKGWFAFIDKPMFPFFSVRLDYHSSDEVGIVEVAALQPGHYELMNFFVSRELQGCKSNQDFSIPFDIKPGQVVYLGNYQAHRIQEIDWPCCGVVFIVEDRLESDLSLAKKRLTSLPVENAQNATPDVEEIGNRFLISPAQAKIAREAANAGALSSPSKEGN